MICEFCKYEFDDSMGRYGCPNCLGEGLEAHSGHRERMMELEITISLQLKSGELAAYAAEYGISESEAEADIEAQCTEFAYQLIEKAG